MVKKSLQLQLNNIYEKCVLINLIHFEESVLLHDMLHWFSTVKQQKQAVEWTILFPSSVSSKHKANFAFKLENGPWGMPICLNK